MAFKEGLLFIVECKDTIHPTDTFEMRTTYDHIKKAVSQIKYVMTALKDEQCSNDFFKKVGIQPADVLEIHPAIVLSNNKFWGYSFEGISIRNFRELHKFITDGIWSISLDESSITKFRIWEKEEFSIDDLKLFLNETESPHNLFFDACHRNEYPVGQHMFQEKYTLLFPPLLEKFKERYTHDTAERLHLPE
jgi:hypothetical protein